MAAPLIADHVTYRLVRPAARGAAYRRLVIAILAFELSSADGSTCTRSLLAEASRHFGPNQVGSFNRNAWARPSELPGHFRPFYARGGQSTLRRTPFRGLQGNVDHAHQDALMLELIDQVRVIVPEQVRAAP